jgi:predicted dienelactone hydrolase
MDEEIEGTGRHFPPHTVAALSYPDLKYLDLTNLAFYQEEPLKVQYWVQKILLISFVLSYLSKLT